MQIGSTSFHRTRSLEQGRCAAIGLRSTLAVIAAATLGFAQAPTQKAGSANSCNVVSTNSQVSTSSRSLVDAAPYLLSMFNNAPVFGLPGTIEGGGWHRTQLIGDPNCKRTDLVRRGAFIDLYSTSAYQNVTSGGLKTGDSFVQSTSFPSIWTRIEQAFGLADLFISLCNLDMEAHPNTRSPRGL
jgi:hypothetical protein